MLYLWADLMDGCVGAWLFGCEDNPVEARLCVKLRGRERSWNECLFDGRGLYLMRSLGVDGLQSG